MGRPTTNDPRTALLVLGVAAGIAQALLLREAMAAMGGSELAWGTVMAVWLLGMAAGSRLGTRFGGATVATALPLATVVLAGFGVVVFRAAPVLVGAAPGETMTAWHSASLWVAAVGPSAVAGGLAFPILAGRNGSGGAGAAYGLEAAGALAGGLVLSLVLAPLGTAAALCLTAAFVAATTRFGPRDLVRWLITAALCAAAGVAGDRLATASWRWAGHPGRLAHWLETRQQRIEASEGPPVSLFADGRLVATFPDPFATVPTAHLLMLIHPDPQRVFAAGALADGSLVTMALHPVRELVVVEEDPQLARRLPSWYGPELEAVVADPRVTIRPTDPLRALRAAELQDLIVLLDGNPVTVRHGRTRTQEFFELCRSRLSNTGVLVVRLDLSDTYLGGSAGRLLDITASTLRRVFEQVTAIPGEEVLLVAGGPTANIDLRPSTLEERWRSRGVTDPLFAPELIELLVDPRRSAALQLALDRAAAPPNTREHPRAVLVSAGLLEARSRPFLLGWSRALEEQPATPLAAALAVAVVVLVGGALRRRPPAIATAVVVGTCSMGWWLLLMAAWQATRGSVYAEVGALSAAFMGGLAAGSLAAARWTRPAVRLPILLVGGASLSMLLATPVVFKAPTLLVPALLFAGGALTGAAFPGIATLSGGVNARRGAGRAFAADEAGAAIAAAVVGILALPWAGARATALGLGALGTAAAVALVVFHRLQRARIGEGQETTPEG